MAEHDTRSDLERRLGRWVQAGLLTPQQADAVRAFEATTHREVRRTPLIAEALGYLGAALALAAGFVTLGRDWSEWSVATRTTILAVATVLLLGGGLLVRAGAEAAVARLASVLWLLSVLAGTWFLGQLFFQSLDWSDDAAAVSMGAGAALYGGVLYFVRRRALQQLGFAVGCAVTAWTIGFVVSPEEAYFDHTLLWVGPAVWLLGIAWLLLVGRGVLPPRRTGYAIGAILALVGPFFRDPDILGVDIALGVLTAIGLLAVSVRVREPVLLGAGALGLFAHLVAAIGEYFGETGRLPIVLLAAGVLLVAIALVTARLRRSTGQSPGG